MVRTDVARLGARPWVVVAVLAMAACQTTATYEPSPAYATVSAQTQANTGQGAGCLDESEHNAVRARILQNSLATATLSCLDDKRVRLLEPKYNQFVQRYNPEYAENARVLRQISARRGKNFDVMNTDMANQAAAQMSADRQFCDRSRRALDWALSPKVTSLSQVPPPVDYTGLLGLRLCKARA